MPVDSRLVANQENWNDRTPVHLASKFYDVEQWLARQPGPRARELDALGDVAGCSLLHLQCHFGLDTLQFARAGAVVTGLDFSPVAIDAARGLARRAGLSARSTFVCADVYDAVDALGGATFDIVYVSLGALTWLPVIDAWAAQVAALVAPAGRFYLHESHPLAWALADEELTIEHTYFEEAQPHVDDSGLTYTDSDVVLDHARTHEWNHGLGEIVTALIRHGLRIDSLIEHDWTVWPRFPWLVREGGTDATDEWILPADVPRLPLSFTLLASKP
jgi:SAM-dependent methyltransferase